MEQKKKKQRIDKTLEFIKKAKLVHKDKYGYTQFEYINNRTKGIIHCEVHGPFEQNPYNHLSGQSCPKCSYDIRANKLASNTEEFIYKAKLVHGEVYEYSEVEYKNSITYVIIRCKVHGYFKQTPNCHLNGRGCRQCAINHTSNKDEFIDKAKRVHGEVYDYTELEYTNDSTNVMIRCKRHGYFKQTPNNHLRGKGCQKCSTDINSKKRSLSIECFIQRSKQKHGDLYDYCKFIYINCYTKGVITCKLHGDFKQTPTDHFAGCGCPKCFSSYSKQQIEWLTFLEVRNSCPIQHAVNEGEYKIPSTNYRADGYCAETNTIYEFHGDFWHGNPNIYNGEDINTATKTTYGELYSNTLKKEDKIKSLGYNLVTIWESDWVKFTKSIKKIQKTFRMRRQFSA